MATKFKKDDIVKLTSVVPQGPVIALRMDEDGNFFYMVEWTDTDGNTTQRWFEEDQLVAA
jgi:uncharacterized protein YodC (DUF2158 family)